jgi:pimeloyl-ACP methyl ester carboxylesterase
VPGADREVQFTVDGTTAYGTVHVPAHRRGARLPAVLLLPGSGPTDRNGDQPPTFTPHTLALIADRLGDDGVMTLRFDKYGSGRTPARDPGDLDIAAFVRQAVGAYGLLTRQPEADRRHVGIAGHSEGGLIATLVALRTHPAALAMIAPQDIRLLDALAMQLDAQFDTAVQAGRLTPEQAATQKGLLADAIAEFRAQAPVDTNGMLPQVKALVDAVFGPLNAKFTRSDDAIYPPVPAAALPMSTKVLLTCGTSDVNVPCATIGPLVAATRHAEGPGLLVLAVDHELHAPGTDPNAQVLAPAVIHTVDHFAHLVR